MSGAVCCALGCDPNLVLREFECLLETSLDFVSPLHLLRADAQVERNWYFPRTLTRLDVAAEMLCGNDLRYLISGTPSYGNLVGVDTIAVGLAENPA